MHPARRPWPLECGVRHYPWGDQQYIPNLLGVDNGGRRPFAELWMGAHPSLPAAIAINGRRESLGDFVREHPEVLGHGRLRGSVPFLFKVLAAAHPLSIQVHPSRRAAIAGFHAEEAAGIPLDAPNRNYRDQNHKPELFMALTPFVALRGFRSLEDIRTTLADTPTLHRFARTIQSHRDLARFYTWLMRLPQSEVDRRLTAILKSMTSTDLERPDPWMRAAHERFRCNHHYDRGLFAFLLLRLIRLRPGQAMYLPSGMLHAYLQGAGLELMANSDNVLRGGLTTKHIDVNALLQNIEFEEPHEIEILEPHRVQSAISLYSTPAEEFELRRISVDEPVRIEPSAISIMLNLSATSVSFECEAGRFELAQGQPWMFPAGLSGILSASWHGAEIYCATVPRF